MIFLAVILFGDLPILYAYDRAIVWESMISIYDGIDLRMTSRS
jgi:hypothetical protein